MTTLHHGSATAPEPRTVGWGWECDCHGAPPPDYDRGAGWDAVWPYAWCPNKRPQRHPDPPAPKVRDAVAIRNRPVVLPSVPLPPGIEPPADVPRLTARLWTLGIPNFATYAICWWSVVTKLDAPGMDGRKTADVPVMLESVALRAWPWFGVAVWTRVMLPDEKWKPDIAWLNAGYRQEVTITRFKQRLAELEKER